MITSLHLKNFKAFENLDVNVRPINVILGPNNSGKSSILAALRILVQTIDSRDPDVPLLLNGIMGDLGTFKDIVYLNNRKKSVELSIGVNELRTSKQINENIDVGNNFFWNYFSDNEIKLKLLYKYRSIRREVVLNSCVLEGKKKNLLSTKYSEDSEKTILDVIGGKEIPPSLKSSFSRNLRMRNFIPQLIILYSTEQELSDLFEKDPRNIIRDISNASRAFTRCIENIEYIGAMRVPPSRIYPYSGERRNRIGASGENVANILAMDAAKGSKKVKNIIMQANDWLVKAGIASNLSIKPTSDSFYELRVQHPITNEIENLADVGIGNSQILPILVGGFNLKSGSTYLVEEPEIHLHPKAQAELGSFFLDLYKGGIQSIIETHSEYLVIRLQQYVADRLISPKDIQFLYIDTDNEKKRVIKLELDKDGFFTTEWPGGFFPEKLEEAKKLARIRMKYS